MLLRTQFWFYAQRARTYLAVRILDLSRVPVQITLFGAEYTLRKAGPAAPVVLALQHPVTERVHRNHTESLSHFKAGPFPTRAAEESVFRVVTMILELHLILLRQSGVHG
ncbi:hypothetical protein J6590_066983, partial [Homalodisca vitripennis]